MTGVGLRPRQNQADASSTGTWDIYSLDRAPMPDIIEVCRLRRSWFSSRSGVAGRRKRHLSSTRSSMKRQGSLSLADITCLRCRLPSCLRRPLPPCPWCRLHPCPGRRLPFHPLRINWFFGRAPAASESGRCVCRDMAYSLDRDGDTKCLT